MKKIVYLAGSLLLAGFLCWSCSDDGDDDGDGGSGKGGVVLDKNTQTEQVVYANDKGGKNDGIKFTTQGPWKAEVEEVATLKSKAAVDKQVEWLALSQYSGDKAGDYTITLTLQQNFTGKTRKAIIRIICGDTVITITVEQKAEKEDGVKLKRVKSVTYTEVCGEGYHGSDGEKGTYVYSYDEQGRVAKVVSTWDEAFGEGSTDTYLFDYHIVGEITVDHHSVNYYTDGTGQKHESESDEKYLLTLNKQGNVVNINESDDYDEADTKVGYTEDGRLGKLSEDSKDGYAWYQKFFYTDGLMTKAEFWEEGYEAEIEEIDVNVAYPNRYSSNSTNIDFNAFIYNLGEDEMEEILHQIGLLGRGSDCLLEIGGYSDGYNESVEPAPFYPEPGKVYKKTNQYISWPDVVNPLPVKYEFDSDKYVTKFSYEDPYELWERSYEVHVGYELIDPENPDRGYNYEIKNEKRTKVSDEKNVYTYTVVYE